MVKINIKKNKKSILQSLVLILVLAIMGMGVVFGNNPSAGTNVWPGGTGYVPGSGAESWSPDALACEHNANILWGVRLALVDKNGVKVPGSRVVDIWPGMPADGAGDLEILALYNPGGNKKLKYEVIRDYPNQQDYQVFGPLATVVAPQWNGDNPQGQGHNIWFMPAWANFGSWTELPMHIGKAMGNATGKSSGARLALTIQTYTQEYFVDKFPDIKNNPDSCNENNEYVKETKNIFRFLGHPIDSKPAKELCFGGGTEDIRDFFIHLEPLLMCTPHQGNNPERAFGDTYTKNYRIYGTITEYAAMGGRFPGYNPTAVAPKNTFTGTVLFFTGYGIRIANDMTRPCNYGGQVDFIGNGTIAANSLCHYNTPGWLYGTPQERLECKERLLRAANPAPTGSRPEECSSSLNWNTLAVGHIWFGEPIETTLGTCPEAADYIRRTFGGNDTQLGHNALLLKNVGYTYKDTTGADMKVDAFPQYNLLDPAFYKSEKYMSGQGTIYNPTGDICTPGMPCCATFIPIDVPPTCNPEVKLDECVEGADQEIFFKDNLTKKCWLEEGTGFDKNSKVSSENTGHTAQDGGITGIVGNDKYCKFYCNETFETEFPFRPEIIAARGAGIPIKAGQSFFWGLDRGYGTYGKITVKKTCSNRQYDGTNNIAPPTTAGPRPNGLNGQLFPEWLFDYRRNEETLINAYLLREALNYQLDIIQTYSRNDCCCHWSIWGSWCCGFTGYASVSSWTNPYSPNQGDATAGRYTFMTYRSSTAPADSASASCYSDGGTAAAEAKKKLEAQIRGRMATATNTWTAARNAEIPNYLNIIRQCYNNIKYKYDTVVSFVFKEPVNPIYGNTRVDEKEFLSPNNNNTWIFEPEGGRNQYETTPNVRLNSGRNGQNCDELTVYTYECTLGAKNNPYCKANEEKVWDCHDKTWTSERSDLPGTFYGIKWELEDEYTYKYQPEEDFKWWSLKTNSKLMNTKTKSGTIGTYRLLDNAYFYNIGWGLPTAFSLTSGEYEMHVVVTVLGDNDQLAKNRPVNQAGHFNPITLGPDDIYPNGLLYSGGIRPEGYVAGIEQQYGFIHTCEYEVDNDMFGWECEYDEDGKLLPHSAIHCDTTKDKTPNGRLDQVDVVYRLVGLLHTSDITPAFPGRDGLGRQPRSNWMEVYDEIPEILSWSKRNTDRAMYEIMLDVNTIQSIRDNNTIYFDKGVDPYASFCVDSNDPNCVHKKIICHGEVGDHKYCASEFLTALANQSLPGKTRTNTLNYPLMGTCITGMGTTQNRAQVGRLCNGTYTYPTIDWGR